MTTKTKKRTQSRALPWFGADTMVCERYAGLLAECRHVTVPFCGGLSIVAHLVATAGEIVCNDRHRHAINFYQVLSHAPLRRALLELLEVTPFHETLLRECQEQCKTGIVEEADIQAAYSYIVTCWMGRSGKAGTTSEFNGGLAMRWDSGGGSSPLRFQTAVRSIPEVWGPICERCSFVCLDWSEILANVKDDPKNGVYVDPPWVGAGDDYRHSFTVSDHVSLRRALDEFQRTKIVVRYGDHQLIREIYESANWSIREITSRDQANGGVAELCITNWNQGGVR